MDFSSSNSVDFSMTYSSMRGEENRHNDDSSEVITSISISDLPENNNKHHHHPPRAVTFRERRRPIPAREHKRRGVAVQNHEGHARGRLPSDEAAEPADWRVLSQPRQRRLSSLFGPVLDTSTGIPSSCDSGSNSELTGSELRARFLALDQAVVKASIGEHVNGLETELEKLEREREQVLRELEEENEEDIDMEVQ